MTLSAQDLAKREEFGAAYRQATLPVMQAVERQVCGCAYGATSWATRDEAEAIAGMLGLDPGMLLLEIGAGSGWPAIYLAERSGCGVVLTDLPIDGLRIAARRADSDGLSGACMAAAADAARLPFPAGTFDTINHSDVLCCLVHKREALGECARLIRPGGRMAFSVIYIPPGLTADDHSRAAETAPAFAATETDYPTMLAGTGWTILERRDRSAAFAESCARWISAVRAARDKLRQVPGAAELDRRSARFRRRITALERGILKRELFLVAAR